ncbi:MAG: YciI family protein [Proteobacteria bacterium]|nr:YciI family protein [Pseudomonadota bacterium]
MLYAIIGRDVPEAAEPRTSARPAHMVRPKQLKNEDHLVLAGPFPVIDGEDPGSEGLTGSLIVAAFADFDTASDWTNADPYVAVGVYKATEVAPFIKVLP